MRARLLEKRIGFNNNYVHPQMIKAGTIVTIIGHDENTGRMIATTGVFTLSLTEDQAEPLQ
jgi:hypothetical protein